MGRQKSLVVLCNPINILKSFTNFIKLAHHK